MYRIGNGFDIHQFERGKKLVLGGIEIEFSYGLKAHSDGDAVIHAVIDSILGASGKQDIGEHFSDKSDEYKNIDSKILLEKTMEMIKDEFQISNIDITIVCQQPKLSTYKGKIKTNLSKIMRIDEERINVKAKTAENMGDIGKTKGIAVISSCLLKKIKKK